MRLCRKPVKVVLRRRHSARMLVTVDEGTVIVLTRETYVSKLNVGGRDAQTSSLDLMAWTSVGGGIPVDEVGSG